MKNQNDNKKQNIGQDSSVKAGLWYVFSSLLTNGIVFLSTPIFSRLLTTSEMGAFSNVSSWQSILLVITTLGLHSSISLARFDFEDDLNGYTSSIVLFGSIITVICYSIVIMFQKFFLSFFSMEPYALHLVFISLMVTPALDIIQARNRITLRYKQTVFVSMVYSLLPILTSVLLVLVSSDRLMGRLYGLFVPRIVICLVIYIYLLAQGRTFKKSYCKYAFSISFPLLFHQLSSRVMNVSDRVMITYFLGEESTAYYTIASTCAMVVSILWQAMNNAWTPWLMHKIKEENYEAIRKRSKPYALSFCIVVFGMLLVAPELLWVMGGETYMQALNVIPPVMIGYVFQFAYTLYVNVEFYFKKQKQIAFGTITAAVINIVLNFIFIPRIGYIAAAYTTLASMVVMFFTHYSIVNNMKYTKLYDTWFVFMFLGVSLVSIPVLLLLYQYTATRYSLLVLLLLAGLTWAVSSRDKIKGFMRKI